MSVSTLGRLVHRRWDQGFVIFGVRCRIPMAVVMAVVLVLLRSSNGSIPSPCNRLPVPIFSVVETLSGEAAAAATAAATAEEAVNGV